MRIAEKKSNTYDDAGKLHRYQFLNVFGGNIPNYIEELLHTCRSSTIWNVHQHNLKFVSRKKQNLDLREVYGVF